MKWGTTLPTISAFRRPNKSPEISLVYVETVSKNKTNWNYPNLNKINIRRTQNSGIHGWKLLFFLKIEQSLSKQKDNKMATRGDVELEVKTCQGSSGAWQWSSWLRVAQWCTGDDKKLQCPSLRDQGRLCIDGAQWGSHRTCEALGRGSYCSNW